MGQYHARRKVSDDDAEPGTSDVESEGLREMGGDRRRPMGDSEGDRLRAIKPS